LFVAAAKAEPNLPAEPVISSQAGAALEAVTLFLAKFREIYGPVGTADPTAWVPERLEYRVEALASMPSGETARFLGDPDRDAAFDWYVFDEVGSAGEPSDAQIVRAKISSLPTPVRFRGMPNARWWDFENAIMDFGAISPDRRDLAKIALMDFMLIHSNDWFVLPLEQNVNTVVRLDALVVRDVFGQSVHVPRAEPVGAPGQRWSMFRHTVHGGTRLATDGFLLPPAVADLSQCSEPVEDVRFIRDEMANMVWAIEHSIEGDTGQPLEGAERYALSQPPDPGAGPVIPPDAPPIRYLIQTSVPEYWIPFVPVALDPALGEVALERAAMLRVPPGEPILPLGRVLNPERFAAQAYRVREEEVGRAGVRVTRMYCRSRWIDGSTHLWIARRKVSGRGEGSSGLRFDLSAPNG
jgi:hypothetical protein